MKHTLHHFAYNIRPNTLESALELFELLGCTLAYREGDVRWCQIEQKPIPIDMQIIEVDEEPIVIDKKTNTHIAFLTDSLQEELEKIKKWTLENNLRFREGAWTEREIWFDLPDVFVNFVIELMHSSVINNK